MKKLIEKTAISQIVCDNPDCDYVHNLHELDKLSDFVNKTCPKCGKNLLTEKDYHDAVTFQKLISFINRWFSWITLFQHKKNKFVEVKIHDGIKIKSLK